MALEIQGIGNSLNAPPNRTDRVAKLERQQKQQRVQGEKIRQQIEASQEVKQQKIQEAVDRLDQFAKSINKRLSYSFNRELNQVVVKVVDAQTDKVIKELPPAELQRLHMKIQEYIGMIIDETV
jgi:flagellar protein FlaG